MNNIIRPRTQVTDQDVVSAMRKRKTDGPLETKVAIRMIFKSKPATSSKEMSRLKRQIETGIPFETIAKRETEGPAKDEGGNIGLVAPTDLQPELATVLEKIKKGEVSGIIETKQGFYLLECYDRQTLATGEGAQLKEQIRDELTKLETDRSFDQFIRELREKAHVEITL
jgi:parvulin-like peptidyl-prolyl isomerase